MLKICLNSMENPTSTWIFHNGFNNGSIADTGIWGCMMMGVYPNLSGFNRIDSRFLRCSSMLDVQWDFDGLLCHRISNQHQPTLWWFGLKMRDGPIRWWFQRGNHEVWGDPVLRQATSQSYLLRLPSLVVFYRAFSRVDFGVVSQLVWVELPGGRINFEIMMWRGRIDFHRNYAADIHAGTGPHVPWYSPNFIGDYSRLSATWLG